jgi:hypothetical protein
MESIQELFGVVTIPTDGCEVALWYSRNFQKSYKTGEVPAEIESLDVQLKKSKLSLILDFAMITQDGMYKIYCYHYR